MCVCVCVCVCECVWVCLCVYNIFWIKFFTWLLFIYVYFKRMPYSKSLNDAVLPLQNFKKKNDLWNTWFLNASSKYVVFERFAEIRGSSTHRSNTWLLYVLPKYVVLSLGRRYVICYICIYYVIPRAFMPVDLNQ